MKITLQQIILFTIIFTSLNALAQIHVACVGNSITEEVGIIEDQKYPARLNKLLGNQYLVKNYGSSGKTYLKNTGDTNSYWDTKKYAEAKEFLPNIVIIELGTNDSKTFYSNYLNTFLEDVKKMVDGFKAVPSNPQIFLCLPPPAFSSIHNIDPAVLKNKITPWIKQAASEKNIPVIDLYTPLVNSPHLFPDGIHPNPEGADSIAQIVYRALINTGTGKGFVKKDPLYLYPNPAPHGLFTLTVQEAMHEKAAINITDISGRSIMTQYFDSLDKNQFVEITLATQAKGVYFVQLISNNNVFSKKVILQ